MASKFWLTAWVGRFLLLPIKGAPEERLPHAIIIVGTPQTWTLNAWNSDIRPLRMEFALSA